MYLSIIYSGRHTSKYSRPVCGSRGDSAAPPAGREGTERTRWHNRPALSWKFGGARNKALDLYTTATGEAGLVISLDRYKWLDSFRLPPVDCVQINEQAPVTQSFLFENIIGHKEVTSEKAERERLTQRLTSHVTE